MKHYLMYLIAFLLLFGGLGCVSKLTNTRLSAYVGTEASMAKLESHAMDGIAAVDVEVPSFTATGQFNPIEIVDLAIKAGKDLVGLFAPVPNAP